jgi:hypothetical protein
LFLHHVGNLRSGVSAGGAGGGQAPLGPHHPLLANFNAIL